ncbi:MAG: hypothetical protein NTW66_04570 [Candidatus Magasanikbacteria bacterium]|nr:hypothetical protein [Candidatus Magasanikbacteria bacterium]
MAGTGANAPQITKTDVYRKLLEKYKEWALLLTEMEKREKELHQAYLKAKDRIKMQAVMNKLNIQK